jgi:hypothetical protein
VDRFCSGAGIHRVLRFDVVVCLRKSKDLHREHGGEAETTGKLTAETQRTQRKPKSTAKSGYATKTGCENCGVSRRREVGALGL